LPVDGNIPTSLNVIFNDMKIPVSISTLIYFPSIILYFAVGLILKYRAGPFIYKI